MIERTLLAAAVIVLVLGVMGQIHGTNGHVPVAEVARNVGFLTQLIRNSDSM